MDTIHRIWVPGVMPFEFLLLLAITLLAGIWIQRVLTRRGLRITTFWQVLLLWAISYAWLKYVMWPPLPFHLFANYMGAITLALFLYAGATEAGWVECKETVVGIFGGRTRTYRMIRVVLFIVLPVTSYGALYQHLGPKVPEALIEFRTYHPAPPRSIWVHGERLELQTAKNPFRVEEGLIPPASWGRTSR
jgi:hypothetical protein